MTTALTRVLTVTGLSGLAIGGTWVAYLLDGAMGVFIWAILVLFGLIGVSVLA